MELTAERKAVIDGKSYMELLRGWRFHEVGDLWFQGETGKYWGDRMAELRAAGADHVGASKSLGWGR